jgi:hypothetical protein
MEAAWCNSVPVAGVDRTKITEALDRIALRGEACADIVAAGWHLLQPSLQLIRVFDKNTGSFEYSGGYGNDAIGVLLERQWFTYNTVRDTRGRNIDSALV